MKKEIIFTKIQDVSDEYFPKPASSFLPEWYKKTSSYKNDKKFTSFQHNDGTIKKCQPVFDALTSGYIIPTYCDIYIKKNELGDIVYLTSDQINIEFHPIIQAPYHPVMNQHPYPKLINPWSIKTPKGYSSLFIPIVHNGNKEIVPLEGFVDTDKYNIGINFPFVLKNTDFEGIIPAGTPFIQVIPVKRDEWVSKKGNEKDLDSIKKDMVLLNSRFYERYKTFFWNKKQYT